MGCLNFITSKTKGSLLIHWEHSAKKYRSSLKIVVCQLEYVQLWTRSKKSEILWRMVGIFFGNITEMG